MSNSGGAESTERTLHDLAPIDRIAKIGAMCIPIFALMTAGLIMMDPANYPEGLIIAWSAMTVIVGALAVLGAALWCAIALYLVR